MKRELVVVALSVCTELVLSRHVEAGENSDYFDKPIAQAEPQAEPVETPTADGMTLLGAAAAPSPKLTAYFQGGYSNATKMIGELGGSYSFQTSAVDIEPAFAVGASDFRTETRAGSFGFDVTIAPKLNLPRWELGLDPGVEVSDAGDATYNGTVVAKASFGDSARGKIVVGASPAIVYSASEYGYAIGGTLGFGRDLRRNSISVTLKPKLSAPTFSADTKVGTTLELLFAMPISGARKLRLAILPSASDVTTIDDTFAIVGKVLVTI